MNQPYSIKSLSLVGQFIFILISALPFWLGIYWLLPLMVTKGYSIGVALSVSIIIPLYFLFISAVYLGLRESNDGISGLVKRWGLKPMTVKDWAWVFFLLAVTLIGYFTLADISSTINSKFIGIYPPEEFGSIITHTTFFGMHLSGNWWALLAHIGLLFINIFGEELWFRGILFPKQKLLYKQHTWWVHGLFYHLWHMFYPWDILRLLPASLAYGWVRQKTDNTWTTIIAHFLFNGIGLYYTTLGILRT